MAQFIAFFPYESNSSLLLSPESYVVMDVNQYLILHRHRNIVIVTTDWTISLLNIFAFPYETTEFEKGYITCPLPKASISKGIRFGFPSVWLESLYFLS